MSLWGRLGQRETARAAQAAFQDAHPGDCSSAQYGQMLVMARLSGWLAGEGLDASDLTPAVLERFIAELRTRGYRNQRSLRGFGTLLGYLRRVGALPVPAEPPVPAPATPEEELLDRYRRYLTGERGVCEQVARAYVGKVRRS